MEVAPKNDINGHISQEILSQLIQKESFSLKSLVLKTHLKKCQRCNEIINIKNYLQQIAGRTKPTENKSHPEVSDLHDSIARIYDSSLSKQEAADFLHHISSCSQCFEYVSFVLEDSLTPVPEEIEKQIDSLANVSLAEMVLNEVPPQESIFKKLLSKIKEILGSIIIPEPKQAPDPAMGLAIPQLRSVFGPAIRIAIPVSLLAVIAVSILLIPGAPSPYGYDDKVPFEYNASSFRGTTGTPHDPDYRAFRDQFLFAISDYMARDYEKVILRLKNVEPAVNSLKAKTLQKEQLAAIRDFFFYLGISHFALSRSKSRDLSNEQKARHSEKATQYLLDAKSLGTENNLEMIDRDTYFLGLTYGFGGQERKAIEHLKVINSESRYHLESQELLHKWSKNN